MQLTKESEYALLGLAYLASQAPGTAVSAADIAKAQKLPRTYLAKILQKLSRHGILAAERGPGCGYALTRLPASITMREILQAVEGRRLLQGCLLWSGHCDSDRPCPLHYRLAALRPPLESLLDTITLAEYAAKSHHAARRYAGVPGSTMG